jgi:transcriptional regulator with XRE-family HTH domain
MAPSSKSKRRIRNTPLGRFLKERRNELGLRQEDIAERAGIRQGDVSNFELGVVTTPRYPILVSLARALECDEKTFFEAIELDRFRDGLLPAPDEVWRVDDPRAELIEAVEQLSSHHVRILVRLARVMAIGVD